MSWSGQALLTFFSPKHPFLRNCFPDDTIANIKLKMIIGSQILIPAVRVITQSEAGRCSNGNLEKGRLKWRTDRTVGCRSS
jgi:hypothetical protein